MLSKKQIKYLKGLANTLDAKYKVGKNEITPHTLELLDNALTAHELIKISLNKSVMDYKTEIASTLAEELHAELIQIIGGVIVLFRKNLKDGKIHIPNI